MDTELNGGNGVGKVEGRDRRNPQELFKELWSQALVAVGQAEEEARRLLDRLSKVIDLNPEELQRYGRDFAERLRTQRGELEHTVEDGIKRAMASFNIPSRSELEEIKVRLDALNRRFEQLSKSRAGQVSKKKTGI
jgi:polyhydroxyalkanoate synthesis regulator phasin